MRGPAVFMGYYKMPDKTAETVDPAGWLMTGDIGEWTADGCLRIIDRKKNIFKLAQGEYVAAEKIENVCARCPLVAQCFVYGDSMQSWLVAVAVVDPDAAAKWAEAEGLPANLEALLDRPDVAQRLHDAVLRQVAAQCKKSKLAGFEIPRRLALEREPWTPDNGLLTPTFKLKRNDAKKRFLPKIDAMYATGPAPLPAAL